MQATNATTATTAPPSPYEFEWQWDRTRQLHLIDYTFHECHQFNRYVTFPWGIGFPTHNASGWYLTASMPDAAIVASVTHVSGFDGGEIVLEPCQTWVPYPPARTLTAPIVNPKFGQSFLIDGQCMEVVVRLDRPNVADCRNGSVSIIAELKSHLCERGPSLDECKPGYKLVTANATGKGISFTAEVDPKGTKGTESPATGTNAPGSQVGSPAPAKTSAAHVHRRASWWIGIAMALGAVVAAA